MTKVFCHRPTRANYRSPPPADIEPTLAEQRRLGAERRELLGADRKVRAANRAHRRQMFKIARNAVRHFNKQTQGQGPRLFLESASISADGLCIFDFILPEGF